MRRVCWEPVWPTVVSEAAVCFRDRFLRRLNPVRGEEPGAMRPSYLYLLRRRPPNCYFGMGKPFMQTTVRSASPGFAWAKPRLAVQRTSPFKTRLVLLSRGAFVLLAMRMRWEPSGERTQIWLSEISET